MPAPRSARPRPTKSAASPAAELAAALASIGGFERRPFVAVATSGGPDSLALAILADRWARARGGVAWALTVDHRLRPESGAEAGRAGEWLAARGIPHAILAWEGAKPATGLQAAAREARYRLLAAWCRARGCLHLLTAHHRDDQAETYLIRRRAKSGPDGLAAMAAVRELAGCRLVRPLLRVSRRSLTEFLVEEGQDWISDPSNRDPRFERVRVRQRASTADPAAIRRHGLERIERERAIDRLIARHVMLSPAGFAVFDPEPVLAATTDDFADRVLARLAMTVGGAVYSPRRERAARLRAGLEAAPERARTLGGCRFVPWRGRVLVLRELAAAAPPLDLEPGQSLVWDGRFAVFAASPGLILGSLGLDGVTAIDRNLRRASADLLPPLVLPTLPAFRDLAGRLEGVPHLGYRRAGAGALPRLGFRPVTPLTHAGFTVV